MVGNSNNGGGARVPGHRSSPQNNDRESGHVAATSAAVEVKQQESPVDVETFEVQAEDEDDLFIDVSSNSE